MGESLAAIAKMLGISRGTVYQAKRGVPVIRSYIECPRCGNRNRLRDRHCRRCHKRLYSGMSSGIQCAGDEIALNLKTTLAGSTPFNFRPWRGGRIMLPSGSPITTLTFYEGKSLGNKTNTQDPTTFVLSRDVAAMTGLVAPGGYKLPDDMFGSHAMVILANAAGDVVITTKG